MEVSCPLHFQQVPFADDEAAWHVTRFANALFFFVVALDGEDSVQKTTFTKWVNVYLSLHNPPYVVNDLFDDFKDGTKLLALIEVLSGQPLVSGR